jgi:hypothetical protein
VVGLDVIGEHLTEVNVTSPTCMVEISEQTGFDVPGMFVDALEVRTLLPPQHLIRPWVDLFHSTMIGVLIIAHENLGESLIRCVSHRARLAAAEARSAAGAFA